MEQRSHKQWYVMQVATGSENRMRADIERACESHDGQTSAADMVGLRELFSPKFASRKKRKGEWVDIERDLLPGYLIADVKNVDVLARVLREVSGFCRLLSDGETYEPLNEAECDWIATQTQPGERVLPLSFGFKEGEKLTVTGGPLKGSEVMVTKLDRKNCMAHVEFHAGTMTIKTTVGLVIMPSGVVRQA